MDNVFTVYKLIILYMLDRAEGEVTQGMLSSFLLESGYANFVSLAESYDQLEKQGLVNIILRTYRIFCSRHLTILCQYKINIIINISF